MAKQKRKAPKRPAGIDIAKLTYEELTRLYLMREDAFRQVCGLVGQASDYARSVIAGLQAATENYLGEDHASYLTAKQMENRVKEEQAARQAARLAAAGAEGKDGGDKGANTSRDAGRVQ